MSSQDYYRPISDIGITSRLDEVPQGYILVSKTVDEKDQVIEVIGLDFK